MSYNKIVLKASGFICSPGRDQKIRYWIVVLFIVSILLTSGFPLASELAFGSKIAQIDCHDIKDNPISIPVKGKVTILLFFNVKKESHQKLAAEFNFVFENMVDQGKKVDLVYISRGELGIFKSLIDRYNISFRFINDVDEKYFSVFDYTCGECKKIIIIDKESKLRYNASYVDIDFMYTIVDRYEKSDKESVHE